MTYKRLIPILALVLGLGACSSRAPTPAELAEHGVTTTTVAPVEPTTTTAPVVPTTTTTAPAEDLAAQPTMPPPTVPHVPTADERIAATVAWWESWDVKEARYSLVQNVKSATDALARGSYEDASLYGRAQVQIFDRLGRQQQGDTPAIVNWTRTCYLVWWQWSDDMSALGRGETIQHPGALDACSAASDEVTKVIAIYEGTS